MKRRWTVCISPEVEDVEIEADKLWYAQDTGWLTFQNSVEPTDPKVMRHVAAFAPDKWVYFKEVTDEPR